METVLIFYRYCGCRNYRSEFLHLRWIAISLAVINAKTKSDARADASDTGFMFFVEVVDFS